LNRGVASFGKKLDWYGLVEKLDVAEERAHSREELVELDEFKVGRAARSSEEHLSLHCETFQRAECKEKCQDAYSAFVLFSSLAPLEVETMGVANVQGSTGGQIAQVAIAVSLVLSALLFYISVPYLRNKATSRLALSDSSFSRFCMRSTR
jgi:hypothetical protein